MYWFLGAGGALASGAGSSGAEFLRVAMGARPAALGENFAGLADDVTAAAWNPAGLGQLTGLELSAMHLSYLEDISYEFLAGSLPVGGAGSLAVSAVYMNVKPFDSTAPGSGQPQGTASDAMVALSWGGTTAKVLSGVPVVDDLYYGVTAKFIYRKLGGYQPAGGSPQSFSATAGAVDVGFLYRASPKVSGGVSVQNIGSTVTFLGDEADALPLSVRGGVGWRPVDGGFLRTVILADVVKPVDPDGGEFESGLWGGLGLEVTIGKLLALRAGFRSGADGPRVVGGAGVEYRGWAVDYAFVPLGDTGTFSLGDFGDAHRVGIRFKLMPPPPLLGRVQDLVAEEAGEGKVGLRWTVLPGAAGYHVEMRGTDDLAFKRLTARPRPEPGLSLKGLKAGGEYVFRIVAVDKSGREGAAREIAHAVPVKKVPLLPAPRGLKAVALDSTSVRLSWQAVPGAKGYDVFYRRKSAGKPAWKKATATPRASAGMVLRKLAADDYDFTVVTVNADGKSGKSTNPVRVTVW